ncbi:N,N'-diacetylchitobiose phosphorylase [Hydrogenispora ethanolica]|uniref:N,N'-diacetylchitobiose phosphorylase n=2 Tax=Hydrogenispora ethanolica TaxID=1082276 RepID=A0A4V2QEA7_HYDET|nr:N,N'-diacetylchitobiose phosphorylase [Hydrogenispora ethanolica]
MFMQYGYFDNGNREYVIERPDVPVSWTNYLGVKDMCAVISHNAGGYAFFEQAQHHRITRFRPNGVPLDRPGHYVYLRDDETGEYWSVSWQPVGKDLTKARYQCRHGLSYSKFSCDYQGIAAEQLLFIPVDDAVELWDVRLRNRSGRPRSLSVFSYVEFSFHHVDIDNQNFQMSLYASGSSYREGVIEYDFFYEPWTCHYFTSAGDPDGFDCLRDRFIGPYRSETDPLAVVQGHCSGSSELGGNHCGALHHRLVLGDGEEARLLFLLGVGDRAAGQAMRAKYRDPAAVDAAFAGLKKYWSEKLEAFQCRTPHPGFDTMINTWTLYQAETCVVWSRFASFIEVGGRTGLGFRDTAQDVMSVAHTHPQKVRQRIIELLRAQVSTGYGLHLFEPEKFDPDRPAPPPFKSPTVVPEPERSSLIHGLKDTCSDDALWLIPSVCEYVKETGDFALLDQVVPFADGGSATVYEHLRRALDFSAEQVGPTGICKGLRADWNDCLNLGGGESAMVSFLHYWALQAFLEAARHLGREEDVQTYGAMAERVRKACEEHLWDGQWYIRGITAQGEKIGTQANDEGKVHLESNSLAVLSGAAAPERARLCMDAVDRHLYSEWGLHLVWPAYSRPDDGIGFVTRVYRGIKENGAIFSHPNPWAMIAECRLGRGDRAMKFYDALLPYRQNDRIEVREAEPYSYCQFIMGRDHTAHGRARHPWLTGTAGWVYTAATHWILGIRPDFDGMIIDPCIPHDWPGFEVRRNWRGASYRITVRNPAGVQRGVRSLTLNGRPVAGPIPPQPAGSRNEVEVLMG